MPVGGFIYEKVIIGIVLVSAVVFTVLFLSTGGARTDAHLINYEMSDDGKTMIMRIGVSSSTGYIKDMKQIDMDNAITML